MGGTQRAYSVRCDTCTFNNVECACVVVSQIDFIASEFKINREIMEKVKNKKLAPDSVEKATAISEVVKDESGMFAIDPTAKKLVYKNYKQFELAGTADAEIKVIATNVHKRFGMKVSVDEVSEVIRYNSNIEYAHYGDTRELYTLNQYLSSANKLTKTVYPEALRDEIYEDASREADRVKAHELFEVAVSPQYMNNLATLMNVHGYEMIPELGSSAYTYDETSSDYDSEDYFEYVADAEYSKHNLRWGR